MNRKEHITLLEFTQQIQWALENTLPANVWLNAEISDINVNRNGHCYLELVEKDENNTGLRAKMRATIWGNTFRLVKPFFETSTNRKLTSGLKVLVLCNASFHPVYGLSLNITDIDPSYTIGEIEKEKRETINRLISEGIFDMNRELSVPVPPKRIAVVSSASAAGFQDFTNQLDNNSFGFRIHFKLFEAQVQGNEAEISMVNALEAIHNEIDKWDLVAIIRGGGSQTDLACFDSYYLASHIAQFPIPVITGIGHERDNTVADLVAHTRLKTPTAAAEFIISHFSEARQLLMSSIDNFVNQTLNFTYELNNILGKKMGKLAPIALKGIGSNLFNIQLLNQKINVSILKLLKNENKEQELRISKLDNILKGTLSNQVQYINYRTNSLKNSTQLILRTNYQKILFHEMASSYADPQKVLKRGFSLTSLNGSIIFDSKQLKKNDRIITHFSSGYIASIVADTDN